MTFDPNQYLAHTAQFNLTHNEQIALINQVHAIMQNSIDRALSCDATTLALLSSQELTCPNTLDKTQLSEIAKDAFDGSHVLNLKAKIKDIK